MNKLFILLLSLFISFNIYSYTYVNNGYGLCEEYSNYYVDKYSFPSYWQSKIVEITKNAANWWNEAGSEHYLHYSGVGYSSPAIEYGDWCPSNGVACTTYWGEYTTCLKHDRQTITINENKGMLPNMKNSYRLQNIIAHEFGHILGLDHSNHVWWNVPPYGFPIKVYEGILMGGVGFNEDRHLSEDDKYGVRSIYGKDDQNLRIGSSYMYTYYPAYGPVNYRTGDTDHQTYSKPQLAFQPDRDKNYDYIMTWVRSSSREINYKFVKDCGTDYNDLCQASSGDLGKVHSINNSITLTSPSIAISDNGQNSLIVWKGENINQIQRDADDIYYAQIPTLSHSHNITSKQIYTENTTYYSGHYKGKTMSQPKVVWIEEWDRFVIFYIELGYSESWRIAYIVSDNKEGEFNNQSTNLNIKYLPNLKANWNPMAINCKQGYKDYEDYSNINKNACLLVFNEIRTDENPSYADSVAKTTFKILELGDNFTFIVKDIIKTGNWNHVGYGHYSLASRRYAHNYYKTVNVLNRITSSGKQIVNNLKFNISRNRYNLDWYGDYLEYEYSSSSYSSRTGYSITYNPDKEIFKYFWIKE